MPSSEELAPDRPICPPMRLKRRYQLQEQVGSGAAGIVYRALDRELNRVVAAKVMRTTTVGNVLDLRSEVLLASRVTNEHVVRIHDVFVSQGKAFLAMDWVDGENLATLLGRVHSLPPSQTFGIGVQICLGMQAIHAAGIVHQDLKPGNVLVRRDGQILIADFGLAKSLLPDNPRLAHTDESCGTPRYMAPEKLAGLPADKRSDFYSFGLILLELLTGTTALEPLEPVRERLLAAGIERHVRSQELQKLAVIDRVIRRCLRLDRYERYTDAAEILSDFEATKSEFENISDDASASSR